MNRSTVVCLLLAGTVVTGCSLFGDDEKEPLVGERVSVLAHQQTLEPDQGVRFIAEGLPRPVLNPDWPQTGGPVGVHIGNAELASSAQKAWQSSAGSGLTDTHPRFPSPIVADGRVYTMDAKLDVSAFAVQNGDRLWHVELVTDESDADAMAGGLAFAGGRVFATTGYGDVIALNAESGDEIWRTPIGTPIHGPPAVAGGRVLAITIENDVIALSAETGARVWPPHQAISEPAGLLGTGTPAVAGDIVVAPFSSGEVVAMRADSGRVLWTDTLGSTRRTDELAFLSDIRATPVIDGEQVYATSFAGVIASIDLFSGQRVWEREAGGLDSPWAAGSYLYFVTGQQELLCLMRDSGAIVWVTQLPRFENEEKREDPVLWYGPILAGSQLIVVSSDKRLIRASPVDGQVIETVELPDPVSRSPVVAQGTLYLLTDDADLIAYR
jgi:outer membrane protein assembly factor BamB